MEARRGRRGADDDESAPVSIEGDDAIKPDAQSIAAAAAPNPPTSVAAAPPVAAAAAATPTEQQSAGESSRTDLLSSRFTTSTLELALEVPSKV